MEERVEFFLFPIFSGAKMINLRHAGCILSPRTHSLPLVSSRLRKSDHKNADLQQCDVSFCKTKGPKQPLHPLKPSNCPQKDHKGLLFPAYWHYPSTGNAVGKKNKSNIDIGDLLPPAKPHWDKPITRMHENIKDHSNCSMPVSN